MQHMLGKSTENWHSKRQIGITLPILYGTSRDKAHIELPYGYDRLFIGRLNMTQFYN